MPPGPWAPPLEELLKRPGFRDPTPEHRAEAKKLLAEAGFPNGFSLEIFGGLHYGAPFDDQVVALPGMLKAIGINATLKVAGLAEYSEAVASWSASTPPTSAPAATSPWKS